MQEPPSLPVTRENLVLFICVENSARSLMAEAMFNAQPPPGWRAVSAGTQPARAPNPRARPMLAEIGLALPPHAPQMLTVDLMDSAALRITMGCLDDASCPARLKRLEVRDWGLPDPGRLDDAGFRQVRESLRQRIDGLKREIALADRRPAARLDSLEA
jgi:arsenate reductase